MTTIAEAAAAYESAKLALADAKEQLAAAEAHEKSCAMKEREAYRAFNEAVDAMKPKRGSRPKKGEGNG
jgi:hypothetical protein